MCQPDFTSSVDFNDLKSFVKAFWYWCVTCGFYGRQESTGKRVKDNRDEVEAGLWIERQVGHAHDVGGENDDDGGDDGVGGGGDDDDEVFEMKNIHFRAERCWLEAKRSLCLAGRRLSLTEW